MNKFKKKLLTILFLGVIIVTASITFLAPPKTYSENEKRILSEFPKLSVDAVLSGEFQDGLETYMSDHLFGRDFFVGISAYFDVVMGRNSLGGIYNAKEGYLINAPKKNGEDFLIRNADNFNKFTMQSGLDSTIVIIPTAGYIMKDKLPLFHSPAKDDALFTMASEHTQSIRFLDVRQCLFDEYTRGEEVYYHTDHHLTSRGSYAVYKSYCNFLNMDVPTEDEYSVESIDGFYGTTYSGSGYFLEKPDTLEIWDLGLDVRVTFEDGKEYETMFFREHLNNMDMYPVYLDGNHSYVKIENPKAKGGNLLVIRDSYGQNMAPFLAYNYKNVVMLDMRYYRGSVDKLAKEENIDSVLYLYGLDTLLTDESSPWLLF